jgi:hypothetical protein
MLSLLLSTKTNEVHNDVQRTILHVSPNCQIDGSNEYYTNYYVIGIGDRAVFIGATEILLIESVLN